MCNLDSVRIVSPRAVVWGIGNGLRTGTQGFHDQLRFRSGHDAIATQTDFPLGALLAQNVSPKCFAVLGFS